MRRRTRTKPRLGRVTRIDSASASAVPWSTDGPDHDAVLAEVDVEVASQGIDAREHLRLPAERGVERVRAGGVQVDDDGH